MKKATMKKSNVVTKKATVKPVKSTIQEYVVIKPVSLGYAKKSLLVGDTLAYDSKDNSITYRGEKIVNSQDFSIMMSVHQRSPEKSFIKECSKDSAEVKKIIAKALVEKNSKKKDNSFMLPVEKSDQDLISEINIEHTQIGKIDQKKKQAERDRIAGNKNIKMEVVSDTSLSIDDLMAKQGDKSLKMPVVKDDGALAGTGNAIGTLKRTSGRPVVKAPAKKAGK